MIDIYSKGEYPANVLSNFSSNSFVLDGVQCSSMEGFLQSLKFWRKKKQQDICKLSGIEAKQAANTFINIRWKLTQTLRWQGKTYKRGSPEYTRLLTRAFDALSTNNTFCKALAATNNEALCHSIRKHNCKDTVLTEEEFIEQLYRIRKIIGRKGGAGA